MLKNISMPVIALALGHLVTDLQAGALPIVLPYLKRPFCFKLFAAGVYCFNTKRNFLCYSATIRLYNR